jgi:hypothetical protein
MPEKSNSPKRKTKKAVSPTPTVARKKSPVKSSAKSSVSPSAPVFYLNCPELTALLTDKPPQGQKGARQFATFDEAKSAAIDALVEAIEQGERQLSALKQASDFAGLSTPR